jgi:carboxymethylenebutenolidase
MCYDDQAKPPVPPGEIGAIHSHDLVLTASDGNQFAAFMATPEKPAPLQVIIYPDVRGLHQFYKELAQRFAEIGITAMALDYFGRTAGLTARNDSFEFMPHVQQMKLETFSLDVQATLDHLRAHTDPNRPTFVVGFCRGGALALMTGTNPAFQFAGLIPFYAGLRPEVLASAAHVLYPVLGLFGGADQGIPENLVRELAVQLDKAGVPHHIEIYPGAPHSFFDRRAEEYADASADAWRRTLAFIKGEKQPETVG